MTELIGVAVFVGFFALVAVRAVAPLTWWRRRRVMVRARRRRGYVA